MGIYHMYTGSDNETHIEELSLEARPDLSDLQSVKGMRIQRTEGGRFIDWHPAPDKRWLVILSGDVEIGLGDGTTHQFHAGDIRLIEDVTGHGHTTRYLTENVSAVMPLQD